MHRMASKKSGRDARNKKNAKQAQYRQGAFPTSTYYCRAWFDTHPEAKSIKI